MSVTTNTLDFLGASIALTKKYKGKNLVQPYPMVKNFTSYSARTQDLTDLRNEILKHASEGHCLLKGRLQKELDNEPRAGSTSPDLPTNWICLDFDGVSSYKSVDSFLQAVGLGDISYIFQYSSSYGIKDKKLRGHAFMMLDLPVEPKRLKLWLMKLNLEFLRKEIELSKNNAALCWPLDITTCQNDKLIYIAPPILEKGTSPFKNDEERVVLVEKEKKCIPHGDIKVTAQATSRETHQLLTELRSKKGLSTEKRQKFISTVTNVLKDNPGRIEITGNIKESNGFYHYNLNGGDSYGYYTPIDDPQYILNFKGEPYIPLDVVCPEQRKTWLDRLKESFIEPEGENKPLFFFDLEKDSYVIGEVTPTGVNYNMTPKRESARMALAGKFEIEWPEDRAIPILKLIDDPTKPVGLDKEEYNVYRPTQYITNAKPNARCPKLISALVKHLVAYDDECYDRFLMWLANAVIHRERNLTAWLFHGVQGTGKNGFLEKVIRPILGPERASSVHVTEFKSSWNSFVRGRQIIFVDEVSRLDLGPAIGVLKNLTGNDNVLIHEKYVREHHVKNFANFIFAANTWESLKIESDDRRFNIAPRQEIPVLRSRHPDGPFDVEDFNKLGDELQAFTDYLAGIEIDKQALLEPVKNTARQFMIEDNYSVEEAFVNALKRGELDFFLSGRPPMSQYQNHLFTKHDQALSYDQFLKAAVGAWRNQTSMVIDRRTLEHLYRVIAGTQNIGTGSQAVINRLKKKGLSSMSPAHDPVSGKTVYGIKVERFVVANAESYESELKELEK